MNKTKIMIVDDSLFSRTMLADVLNGAGYEVVGEADSIKNLIEIFKNSKPDLVTMDIAMPGADGFECSKQLLAIDPSLKILIVSSMKDDETISTAKHVGIAGYIQKPIEPKQLIKIVNNIFTPDDLYENLQKWSIDIFKESLSQNITRMTKLPSTLTDKTWSENNISHGITAVIGIIGKYSGTMILDLSVETAEKMIETIYNRKPNKHEEVFAMVAEFANIISGIACSMLNNRENLFSFRVAPPSILYGALTEIVNPSIQVDCFSAETKFGEINLSIGFKKEAVLWM